MIADVEYDIDELPDSYLSKDATIVFDKRDDWKYGVLSL